MGTFILKRKTYASVRNPYMERRMPQESTNEEIAEDNGTSQADEEMDGNKTPSKVSKVTANKDKNKTPVYQNLNKNNRIDKVNDATNRDKNRLRNKTTNQNINITRNTNINNPSKEKAAELDAQVKMAKVHQKEAQNAGVNEKLIEIQKTSPLKPLSMS